MHWRVTIETECGGFRATIFVRVDCPDEFAEVRAVRETAFALTGSFPVATWHGAPA